VFAKAIGQCIIVLRRWMTLTKIINTKNKFEMKNNMKQATIQLETLTCPSCIQKIEAALKGLGGVEKESVKVMFNSSKVKVDFDEDKVSVEQIEKSITKMGYEVKKSKVKQA